MADAEKSEITLYPYGDKELWVLDADDRSWSIPVWVRWLEDKERARHYARVMPVGCLYHSQIIAVTPKFEVHDIEGRPGRWLIPRNIAEVILRKAPGVSPEYYYRWPELDCPLIPKDEKEVISSIEMKRHPPASDDSFLRWLAKRRKLPFSVVKVVMGAVSGEATEWMVEHRKEIDLGFCKLAALPFRANWKQIVEFKCRKVKLRGVLNLPDHEKWKGLESIDFPNVVASPHNIGFRRSGKGEIARFDYTIEAIPSAKFESETNRIEGKRLARGDTAYISEFENAVESLYKSIVNVLHSYLQKVVRPYAEVRARSGAGVWGFVPVLGRRITVRDAPIDRLPTHIVAPDSAFSVFGKENDPRLISAQVKQMPALPDLSPGINDLREREEQRRLENSDGETGADGVPLLDAGEISAPGQPMLSEPEDPRDGLDNGGNI